MKPLLPRRSAHLPLLLALLSLGLSGCGLLGIGSFGPEPTAEPTPAEQRALVPTFTPTPVGEPALPTEAPVAAPTDPPPAAVVEQAAPISVTTALSATAALTATTGQTSVVDAPAAAATPVPATVAKFTVTEALVNVRTGPGTQYGLAGSVEANQTLDIQGKNAAGDWWQVCCANGQTVWIFGQLGRAEGAENVAVAADIPTPPPVAVAPTQPAVAAVPTQPPAAAPAPTEAPPAAPPPAADACAGIGGDGCKFKVREGPKFAPNGGNEIKLQLFFIHSGVDGGQPQGSYFVVLTKDGQKLPISDGVRSLANSSNQGTLGKYNYEYKIGIDQIPGNTVAGNYTMHVLDGNGERDSQDFGFSIPDGQGEVWLTWDQG